MKRYVLTGVVLVLFGAIGGLLYSTLFDKVLYSSNTQLIVLSPKTANQAKDYASIATSRTVLESVQRKAGVVDSVDTLQGYVKATNTAGTNMVEVEVTTGNADKSKNLAAAIAIAIGEQAELLYGENNTSIVDRASDAAQTGNPNPARATIFGAVAGFMLALALTFVFYEAKDTKSENNSSNHDDDEGDAGDTELKALTLEDVAREIPQEKPQSPVEIRPVGYKYTYTYTGSKKDGAAVAKAEAPSSRRVKKST